MVDAHMLRGRAFTGSGGEERAYRAGLQIRAAIYGDAAAIKECVKLGIRIKSQTEGVNSAGGFLVTDELEKEILSLRDLAGVFRKNARVLPIGSDARSWPRRVTGLTVAATGEGSAAGESSAAFDAIGFTAKKLAGLVRLSSEVYEDETVGLAAWLAEELAWSFADQEDSWGFTGDGTSAFGGVRGLTALAVDGNHNAGKYTAASAHTAFNTLDATDIAGFVGLLPAYAVPSASFFMSHAAFSNCFFRIAQVNGALTNAIENGETVWRYLGIPIRLTPKLPTSTSSLTGKAMMFCGDLRLAAAVAQRRGVTVRTSEDRYLDTDQIAVLGTERIDIVTHGMGDNTTAGPLVALVAP
jgi:HK97 family phage major capsid protein